MSKTAKKSNGKLTLFDKTMDLLRKSGQSYLQIYEGTGLRPNWLSMVVTRRIRNPGIHTIQKLHDYLLAAEARK